MEQRKREIAHKLRIGEILRGKPIITEDENPKFKFLELGDRKIQRVNVIANVIDKFISESEKKFATLSLDDASGQISAKVFGDDVRLFEEVSPGHTLRLIGFLRYFNNEVYILPEIAKQVDPRYLLIRKLEIEKSLPKEVKKEELTAVKDQIISKIKEKESSEGIESEELIMNISANPELINQEIRRLLEEGIIYEPRPGRLRYLG